MTRTVWHWDDIILAFVAGLGAGLIVGTILAHTAAGASPTPRAEAHADRPSLPGRMTTDGRHVPVPSPTVEPLRGQPDCSSRRPHPAGPAADRITPSPSPIGTRPAVKATPRTATPPGHSIAGRATWFRSPANVSAAGPALRRAIGPRWRGTVVRVCSGSRCVRTVLSDWMRADRLIDLDDGVVRRLGLSLSQGVYRVTVTW
jgi:hypothetical protein